MKKHKETRKQSLLAAALLAVAIGPSWAGDTAQTEEQAYRRFLLAELRDDLRKSIDSLSLERADVVQRIANQERALRGAQDGDVRDFGPAKTKEVAL